MANKIIVITGPTATGKTALGVRLAKTLGGEVVSADSMQIYKFMDIGTAKPTCAEMDGVIHHMLDIAPPWEDYSVARYIEDASRCIDGILKRGRPVLLVGGTGLYIDSLISGRFFAARGDWVLRGKLSEEYDQAGGGAMLEKLRAFDPEAAERLHSNDKKRIVRAIEVYLATGVTITEHDRRTRMAAPRFEAVKLALGFKSRAELYGRIDNRVDKMLDMGFEGEVRRLLAMDVSRDATAMQAIGYKELAATVFGECTACEAAESIKRESRRYAKRQIAWLRRDESAKWIEWDKTPDFDLGLAISTEYLQKAGYNEAVCRQNL